MVAVWLKQTSMVATMGFGSFDNDDVVLHPPGEQLCPFPFSRSAGPLDPPPEYAALRGESPVSKVRMWNGAEAWIFTRWDDVRQLLSSPHFSAVPSKPGYPMLSPARASSLEAYQTFITMDPPDHTYFRRMITKEFTVKRMEGLRPSVQALTDKLLSDMASAGPPADLVEGLAGPLPSIVVSLLLGVPVEHHAEMAALGAQKNDLSADPAVPAEASRKMSSLLDHILQDKEKTAVDGDDMLSRLVIEQIRPGHLSHAQAVAMANLVYLAGHETTTNQISLGVLTLLLNPEQRRLIESSQEKLGGAVEEMLRFNSIVQYNSARVATADVEIGGCHIKAGEGVYALITAANRDPAAFPDPDRFDVGRDASNHMAFSFGIHQCTGQSLARMELQCVFGSIFRKLPGLALAVPFEDLEFKNEQLVHGLRELPITWSGS